MNCSTHPNKASVGYCKKCGKFGCSECLTKVAVRGDVGKQSRPTEALLCRDCLGKIRPDAAPKKSAPARKSGKTPVTQNRKPRQKLPRPLAVALFIFLAGLAAFAVTMLIVQANPSRRFMSAEEVAKQTLEAVANGDTNSFLSCVDVRTFIFKMDPTGLIQRDYEKADRKRRAELEASHSELLSRDFLVTSNLKKKFEISEKDMKENTASFTIKPWIQFGSKLYKQILLEKRKGQWRVSGLASPDF